MTVNHEPLRRGENFETRKTTRGVAPLLKTGTMLQLGSLDSRRDARHCRYHVEAMRVMLQQPASSDSVIGTSVTRSVQDLAEVAFGRLGLDARDHLDLDAAYVRPSEETELLADPRSLIETWLAISKSALRK